MPDALLDAIVSELRAAGARFAYVFGSHASGTAGPASDIDVAAWFGVGGIDASVTASGLPGRVDVLILDDAPFELAGRVAMQGRLLFDDDPPARVAWEATTRRIWLDERPRVEQARRDFIAGAARRGRR